MATAEAGAPRVFFVEPADGATVQAPVHLVFGAENYTIEPAGEIHEGAGHMHIGVDTDCLPAGEIIPNANPWVHFGKAQMEFDLDREPGEHVIVLQAGDGEHRTLPDPGLCAKITITVERTADAAASSTQESSTDSPASPVDLRLRGGY